MSLMIDLDCGFGDRLICGTENDSPKTSKMIRLFGFPLYSLATVHREYSSGDPIFSIIIVEVVSLSFQVVTNFRALRHGNFLLL